MEIEEPTTKKRRGPYKRYLYDRRLPIPKTTKWRHELQAKATIQRYINFYAPHAIIHIDYKQYFLINDYGKLGSMVYS